MVMVMGMPEGKRAISKASFKPTVKWEGLLYNLEAQWGEVVPFTWRREAIYVQVLAIFFGVFYTKRRPITQSEWSLLFSP